MLMPIAFQLARRTGTSSSLLMPMSFGALLGGIVTLVGTSPNIIVSRVREQLLGQPYNMFDFTPVGAGIAIAGFLFLVFGWRLLPQNIQGSGLHGCGLQSRRLHHGSHPRPRPRPPQA